ncbi:hypothetical protein Pcac1_g15598 [Phytophthora cactorum]|nr:hypothetical protein Pcac1_g15598 [Phytophthora cactorum]
MYLWGQTRPPNPKSWASSWYDTARRHDQRLWRFMGTRLSAACGSARTVHVGHSSAADSALRRMPTEVGVSDKISQWLSAFLLRTMPEQVP